jgi:hypothetical protein
MADPSWFVLRGDLAGNAPHGTSPDIILGGPKPDGKYAGEYDTAFNAIATFGGSNYVYVRARNAGDAQAIGSVSVYAAQVGSLQNRNEWHRLQTSDHRPNTNISAPAGDVGVNGAPLVWKPGDAPPAGAPWCLIAEIDGDGHPPVKVPTSVKDKASFDSWIADEPRLAYLIVQAPKVAPVEAPTFGWSREVQLGNAEATTLSVSLTCTKGPAGGSLAYSFDQNDSSGQAIAVGKTKYQVNSVYSQSGPVAADFASTVSVSFMPTGDDDVDAEFTLEVATESDDGDDGEDLGTTTRTVVASYTLSFGQTHRGTAGT